MASLTLLLFIPSSHFNPNLDLKPRLKQCNYLLFCDSNSHHSLPSILGFNIYYSSYFFSLPTKHPSTIHTFLLRINYLYNKLYFFPTSMEEWDKEKNVDVREEYMDEKDEKKKLWMIKISERRKQIWVKEIGL